jgi:TatD DNase family protein
VPRKHALKSSLKLYSLIDTHAHLDELQNLDSTLDNARERGIVAIIAVGSDYRSNTKTLEISQKYPSFVFPALGLHPWQLGELNSSQVNGELEFIEQNISQAIAIGEIGLDYDKRVVKRASKEFQKEVLARFLELAKKYDKPVSLHTRYAWKDGLQLVQDAGIAKAVFHWFTGFSSVLRDIINGGYYVSATPAAEYHEEHRRAVKETPMDKLLLETDCPVYYGRGTRYRSAPGDITRSLSAVAQLKKIDEAAVAEYTTRNAIELFSLENVIASEAKQSRSPLNPGRRSNDNNKR